MNQPPIDQPPPNREVPSNKLNTRTLWLTLLLPVGLTAGFLALMVSSGSGRLEETYFNVGSIVVVVASIACWIAFAKCLAVRYAGASLVFLILAYPVIQATLIFCAFFVGCLVMLQSSGFH